MANENDRRQVRVAVKRRWDISAKARVDAVRALRDALEIAKKRNDPRAIRGIVRTLAALEGQNQHDEFRYKSRSPFDPTLAPIDPGPAPAAPSVQTNLQVNVGVQLDPTFRDRMTRNPAAMLKLIELQRELGMDDPGGAVKAPDAAVGSVKPIAPALPETNGHLPGHQNGQANGHAGG